MRKNAFTLIELLAVIVILAIVALIATPIILGIINDAKEEANKRSVDNYAKAVQNAVVRNQLVENNNINGCFTTEDGTNLTLLDKTQPSLIIEYEGSNIKCNIIEIYKDGNVYLDECIVNGSDKKYSYGKKQGYNDGDIVFFDVYNGVSCTEDDYHVDNSKTGYNGIYEGEASRKTTNNQNGCLKFYAFNDSCGDKINLLLDHNITTRVAWVTPDDYNDEENWNKQLYTLKGPITILKRLKEDVKGWKGMLEPSSYTIDQSTQISQVKYTIDYVGYKARLITAQEIAQITKKDNWNEISANRGFSFNESSEQDETTGISKYYWLFDRTYNCINYGCKESDSSAGDYWTITPAAYEPRGAYHVRPEGGMGAANVSLIKNGGIRPVIEVSKSKLQIN